MKLSELQAMFQAGVLGGAESDGAAVLDAVRNSKRADRATLFGVYVNAYHARLTEFLVADFPGLRALVGEEAFDALAADYIAAGPSRQRNARWYTSRLPEFMQQSEKWRNERRAIDVARLERALTDAFDAPDAAALSLDALAAFEPAQWPLLAFGFHPSLFLLDLNAGTLATHEAAIGGGDVPPPRSGEEKVAVWRSGEDSVCCELEEDEFLVLSLAVSGRAFGEICRMAAFRDSGDAAPERIARVLTGWFEEGLVVAVTLGARGDGAGPSEAA